MGKRGGGDRLVGKNSTAVYNAWLCGALWGIMGLFQRFEMLLRMCRALFRCDEQHSVIVPAIPGGMRHYRDNT